MAEMTDDTLLSLLQQYEKGAAEYTTGTLRAQRDAAVKAYYQRPYGNEQPGWSQYVDSTVKDTIEWMLPDLLDQFVSSDKAVEFEPTRASEVEGAKQATEGCNHVFYQQNNGFWVLYEAFKDALMVKNCAIHWRKEVKQERVYQTFRDLSPVEVEALLSQMPEDAEIVAAQPSSVRPAANPLAPNGMPLIDAATGRPMLEQLFSGRIAYTTSRNAVKVEAFEPENLLVAQWWTSPFLAECPYVCRMMEVTLSDLRQMGFKPKDVDADDLSGSEAPAGLNDIDKNDRTGDSNLPIQQRDQAGIESDDESQTVGYLRIEWVLCDFDGSGIAQRREIYRLDDEILSNEPCEDVPVCTGSPVPVPHRWIGSSMAEEVEDLQMLSTELLRSMINNAYSANNPRKTVLTERGAPLADIGDLLDGRPGGLVRIHRPDAVGYEVTPYVGNQMEPMLQRIDQMREQRTGVTKQRMGMDPNSIRTDRTLGETNIIDQASKQRNKLVARIFAELIVKPTFQGILKLLTSGDFDTLFFKLRGKFVEYDPNDWARSYNMTCNVGLGTGDTQQQMATLRGIFQTQMQLAQTPLGPMLVASPSKIFNTLERMADLGGFKDIGQFFTDPGPDSKIPTPPPPPPPPQLLVEQMRLQAKGAELKQQGDLELARMRFEYAQKDKQAQDQNAVQAANDERDAARALAEQEAQERIKAADVAVAKYKVDQDNRTKLAQTLMQNPTAVLPPGFALDPITGTFAGPDPLGELMDTLQAIYENQNEPGEIVRDDAGNIVGVNKGGRFRQAVRDEAGNIVSVQ